jgi:protoheme ferro-lyase
MARDETETGPRFGVLLTLRGGPAHIDEASPFLHAVLGREPSAEELQGAVTRYLTIGGGSPATFAAERIAAGLERRLSGLIAAPPMDADLRSVMMHGGDTGRVSEGVRLPVLFGCSAWAPSIADAVAGLEAAGCRRIVHIDLSPLEHESAVAERAAAVRSAAAVAIVDAGSIALSENVVGFLRDEVAAAWDEIKQCKRRLALFTYPSGAEGTSGSTPPQVRALMERVASVLALPAVDSNAVAKRLGVEAEGGAGDFAWVIAPLGDQAVQGSAAAARVVEIIDAAADKGLDGIAVMPVGYTIDDDATLYLIDVLAADAALSRGVEFVRSRVPNDDDLLITALAMAVNAVV